MSWSTGWYGFDPTSELHEAWVPEEAQGGAAAHPSADAPPDAEVVTFAVIGFRDAVDLCSALRLADSAAVSEIVDAALHDRSTLDKLEAKFEATGADLLEAIEHLSSRERLYAKGATESAAAHAKTLRALRDAEYGLIGAARLLAGEIDRSPAFDDALKRVRDRDADPVEAPAS